jgi:membrane protein YqaA with SNARE-associated domain
MKTLPLLFAISWAHWILRFLRRLGPFGLLIFGALDSSFLVLPFGMDMYLIALVSSHRSGMQWILYVLMAAMGSLIGVLIVDAIMRKAGEEGLEKFFKPNQIERFRKKVDKGAGWAVFMATVLPPPFPFTPIVMVSSALQCSRNRLIAAVLTGRILRYTLEALLALYFGSQILAYLNSRAVEYFVYAFIVIAVVGSILSVMKWVKSRYSGSSTVSQKTENEMNRLAAIPSRSGK